MRVRFLGGNGAKFMRANPSAEPTAVGDILELDEQAIAIMRAHRYRFETVDEQDTLPAPRQMPMPESVVRQQQRERLQRMREDHERQVLEEQQRIREERNEQYAQSSPNLTDDDKEDVGESDEQ